MKLDVLLALPLLASQAAAQQTSERFEVLSRLREFEKHWTQARPTDRLRQQRLDSIASVVEAATEYSNGRLIECTRCLNRAQSSLCGQEQRGGYSNLRIVVWPKLCDRSESELYAQAKPLNGTAWSPTLQLVCELEGEPRDSSQEASPDDPWPEFTAPVRVQARRVGLGDRELSISVWPGDWMARVMTQRVSIVERLDERLTALESAIPAAREKGSKLELETAEILRGLLNSLASGSTEAHEYPGARLLAEAEQVVAAAAKGERWYGPERDGEFWLALPVGDASVRTRVFVPKGLTKEKAAPLVLALHGRAFDEDTWFDGYGCGQSVELARKRGWLFAAPRCDGNEDAAKLAAIAKALGDVYPVDSSRVMLVGHSRGGGSVLAALAKNPAPFRAAATIGSALAPEQAAALAKFPLFLAAGERDFAREGVEAFHKSLVEAGSTTATLRIYAHTEHWLAVTDALPDVFAWFD